MTDSVDNISNNGDPAAQPNTVPPANLFTSVIICTYGRATALVDLLDALDAQTYRDFEVLIIDGNDEPSPAHTAVDSFRKRSGTRTQVEIVKSSKGLTRQRNLGMDVAKGDLFCFFDDDVTFADDFLLGVVQLFSDPEMQDVGAITPYDTLHYPTPITWRWRLRAALNVMPGIDPGNADHLGRAVPLSFLSPWAGRKEVGWLPGFCMIYRRSATRGITFDEMLPTYGGEDRDFSIHVGRYHRMLICGDIHLQHHYTVEGRDDGLIRLRQSSFGVGRRFAKSAHTLRDYLTVAQTVLGDFLIDLAVFILRPRRTTFSAIFVRVAGCWEGLRSGGSANGNLTPSTDTLTGT